MSETELNMPGTGAAPQITQDIKEEPKDFGWSPEMVDDHTKELFDEKGVQADIYFTGTEFENSFDDAESTLRTLAQNKMGPITVNNREYQITEEPNPEEKDGVPMVAIKRTLIRLINGRWEVKGRGAGSYYFVNAQEKGKILGLRGAHLHQDFILDDIKQILTIAKENNKLVEDCSYSRVKNPTLAVTGAYAEKKIRENKILPYLVGKEKIEEIASQRGERAMEKELREKDRQELKEAIANSPSKESDLYFQKKEIE